MKRFLTLLALVALTITANAVIQSGSCGDNVTFVLNDDGTLVISGSGEMTNYTSSSLVPWYNNRSKIIKAQIEDGVTSIGRDAFYMCSALTSVTIPNSVISIEDYAFSDCFGLISVTIGNSVTSIGYCAFFRCSSLASIVIPNSVTSIGQQAFDYCSGLTSITIPNSVTSIRNCAFRYCSKLKEIHSQAITPPTAYNETFDGVSTNCKLYVPIGTKEDYAFAKGWNVFMNIIEESIISDGDNKCDAPTIEFIDGHLKFSSATPNATFSYTITDEDIKTSLQECVSGDLPLTATYNITVYAFAEGYDASNATTATLHWIDGTLSSADGIKSIGTKRAVLVSSRDGKVKTSGLSDGEKVEAYTIDGKYIGCAYAVDDAAYISAQSGEVVVLKIGKESIKTIVK